MIIMDIKADNLYAFKNFHMNMSYPKKIVDTAVPEEYLAERPNFRYKKINVIMGSNASGKTTLGKLLMLFANYFKDGIRGRFADIIDDSTQKAELAVDFVTEPDRLCRFHMRTEGKTKNCGYSEKEIAVSIVYTMIGKRENYETCAQRLNEGQGIGISYDQINTRGWHFSYPLDAWKNKTYYTIEDSDQYLHILQQILMTLDPSVKSVIRLQDVDNTYAVKLQNRTVLIQDGRIVETELLSSGTKAGLDISYIIASIICRRHNLYYCDELFSYVNSDIEKACLSVMIERLSGARQLFFTTHNTDILDMQLPKHALTFLKKDVYDPCTPIKCVYAHDYLKRSSDSLKNAVENDLFCTSPDLSRLYEIAEL